MLRPGWRDSLRIYRDLVQASLPEGGRLLDLGCGHADWLSPELGMAGLIAGLDPDAEALRRNTSHPGRVVGTAEYLPFADESLDLVVSAWVLEHLDRPAQAVREIARVLRPGGGWSF